MIKSINRILFYFISIFYIVGCSYRTTKKVDNSKVQNSISKKFKNNFLIGVAINKNQILNHDSKSFELIKREFNSVSPENCMKWESIMPEPLKYSFELADKYVAFGKQNKMHTVGHTLVWHSQLPAFMHKVKYPILMNTYIKKHIKKLVTRYKGKIDTWDVVNEALNNDGTLRKSLFLNVIGEKYIENAFKLAEKFDSKANLVYNDFNLCSPKKRQGAVRMIKKIQKSGAKINGIGIQAHWGLSYPTMEEIEKSIITFARLGLKVSFTELDISVLPNPKDLEGADVNQNFDNYKGDIKMNLYPNKLPNSVQDQLANRYQRIFQLFLKHKDKIDRVTFWGLTYENSWLNDFPIKGRTNYPLLFNRQYKPKKAYKHILSLKG